MSGGEGSRKISSGRRLEPFTQPRPDSALPPSRAGASSAGDKCDDASEVERQLDKTLELRDHDSHVVRREIVRNQARMHIIFIQGQANIRSRHLDMTLRMDQYEGITGQRQTKERQQAEEIFDRALKSLQAVPITEEVDMYQESLRRQLEALDTELRPIRETCDLYQAMKDLQGEITEHWGVINQTIEDFIFIMTKIIESQEREVHAGFTPESYESSQILLRSFDDILDETLPLEEISQENKSRIKDLFLHFNRSRAFRIARTVLQKISSHLKDETKRLQVSSTVLQCDIHGELVGLIQNLYMAGLIDEFGHWIGGTRKLVVDGDWVDRGKYSWETYLYLLALQKEASKVGGEVALNLGNHEFHIMKFGSDAANPESGFDTLYMDFLQERLQEDILSGRIRFASVLHSNAWTTHAGARQFIQKLAYCEILKKSLEGKSWHKERQDLKLSDIVEWMNCKLMEDVRRAKDHPEEMDIIFAHPLYRVGESRGGEGIPEDKAGPLWTDGQVWVAKKEFARAKAVPLSKPYQFIGHTDIARGRVVLKNHLCFMDVHLSREERSDLLTPPPDPSETSAEDSLRGHQEFVVIQEDKAYTIKSPRGIQDNFDPESWSIGMLVEDLRV